MLSVALILLLTTLVTPSSAQDGEQAPLVRIAIRADEGPFNPFVAPNDVAIAHDLLMLVYDSLFWTQSRVAARPSRCGSRPMAPPPWPATRLD
ncbi:MAG: hypothetical protein AAFO29_03995 [Actinomycetota bacterium]